MFFEFFEMDRPLSGLKRKQGANVSEVAQALIAKSMQMRGLSINRMEDIIEDDVQRETYGLSKDVDKNDLYRVNKYLGMGIEPIIRHMDTIMKRKLGITFEKVFIDWSATYIDGKPNKFIKYGFTKDHRSDRPQISIGLSMDSATGLPIGLTVMPGNTVDVDHFKKSFKQISPFLEKDCLIVFDNGGYSEENAKTVTKAGLHFLTRAQMNASDDRKVASPASDWEMVDDDVCAHRFVGNLGYTKCIFFSSKRYEELILGYYQKAENDYDEMLELKKSIETGKRLRKKYRNGNMFVDTRFSFLFPLNGRTREEAIEEAVKHRITGREGYFVLTSSKDMTASEMLSVYRSRNDIEEAYRDLKHGIDIRPLRCKDTLSIKGRVLIAFLAYFVLAFAKYMNPDIRGKTAETLVDEIKSFSVTFVREKGIVKSTIYSNFTSTFRSLLEIIPNVIDSISRNERPFGPRSPVS